MTFLEAALEILRRERKPLHYKDITQRAVDKKMLSFVGRTPEVTMQTQLTAAVKKAPGAPFVRVKPGTFGLLRYPTAAELPPEPEAEEKEKAKEKAQPSSGASSAAAAGEARGRRRRRGGRGRGRREDIRTSGENGAAAHAAEAAPEGAMADDDDNAASEGPDEPEVGAMSPEARAAALAESGVLESDGEGEEEAGEEEAEGAALEAAGDDEAAEGEEEGEDEGEGEGESEAAGAQEASEEGEAAGDDDDLAEEGAEPALGGPAEGGAGFEEAGGRRRRRRRRRRRGGEGGMVEAGAEGGMSFGAAPSSPALSAEAGTESLGSALGEALPATEGVPAPAAPSASDSGDSGAGRRIMSPIDAAIEILRGQSPGRGMHVRQLADAATRRRLVHGEPNEAWRVMRAALAAEPRERLRAGLRPRVRSAGSGLFALSRRPPDLDLERAEHVFGEARRALRERTLAGLEQRLSELSPSAFEAIARVLLQREGFGPATFVKRVEGTIYLEALRGRGARPSRCLIALRPGGVSAGRRSIGELRAGIRARNQDEGVLLLAARLADDAVAEWKQPGPPIEVADGPALAETCVRHGVGVVNTMVSVDFVDADFFAELQEG
jgi:hypothetical protein